MKKTIYIAILIFLILRSGLACLGQNKTPIKRHDWGYSINNTNFFSNKEYNSNILDGYTLGGSWLKACLTYSISNTLFLSGGLYYQSHYGDPKLESRYPLVLRATYRPSEHFSITMGDIHTNDKHFLPNHLFNDDLILQDPIEEGISLKYKTDALFIESWIDWERYIITGSPFREEFLFGTSGKYELIKANNYLNNLNFALLIKHKGGEIDNSPLTVQTLLNSRIGFNQTYAFNSMAQLNFGTDLMYYLNNSGTPEIPLKNGYALNIYGGMKIKSWQFLVDYWHSDTYYTIMGDPYFSNYINNEVLPQRNAITFSQIWKNDITNSANITFNNQLLYDFSQTKMDIYTTLKLVIFINKKF